MDQPLRIDIHHHFLPPKIVQLLEKRSDITGGLRAPEWTVSKSLEFMARHKIGRAIFSLPIPADVLTKDSTEAAALCYEMNKDMAALRDAYPAQFGFFATVPSPENQEACIKAILHALLELGADGVTFFTSYSGKYLGHPDFEGVWKTLAEHAAIVFIHPTIEGAEDAIQQPFTLPRPLCDWTHETTRTAIHLITTGTLRKHPGCRVILSHGGGTLPYVAGRAADLTIQMRLTDRPAGDFMQDCRSFYFDVALAGYQGPLKLLLDFANADHVLFGSDFPFARDGVVAQQLEDMDRVLSERGITAEVYQGAAASLLKMEGE